jgi:hypothetical protein
MSKTIDEVCAAFAAGHDAKNKIAAAYGSAYFLRGQKIAIRQLDGWLKLDWCGRYTPETANHMNRILKTLGYTKNRMSYATARDKGHEAAFIDAKELNWTHKGELK